MSTLIDRLGYVDPFLIELAARNGLKVPENISPKGMNAVLQSKWIQARKFRFQIAGTSPTDDQLELLRKLDCIDPISVCSDKNRHYDGALLMGTIAPRFRVRLDFLVKEFERGARFRRVYLLGSERVLDSQTEDIDGLTLPTTELEMMSHVIGESGIPSEWEIIPVKTPDIMLGGVRHRTANTGDTFVQWQMNTKCRAGRFLVASNQPFVHYQEINARRVVVHDVALFGIGQSADISLPIEVFWDNLAKQFFEEFLLGNYSTD